MWVVFRDLFPLYRQLVLHSVNVGVLGALSTFGAAPRPQKLGTQAVHMACESAVCNIMKPLAVRRRQSISQSLAAVLMLLLLGAILPPCRCARLVWHTIAGTVSFNTKLYFHSRRG